MIGLKIAAIEHWNNRKKYDWDLDLRTLNILRGQIEDELDAHKRITDKLTVEQRIESNWDEIFAADIIEVELTLEEILNEINGKKGI